MDGQLAGMRDGRKNSIGPRAASLPSTLVVVFEWSRTPDVRAEEGMGRRGGSDGRRAAGSPTDAEKGSRAPRGWRGYTTAWCPAAWRWRNDA